MKKNKKIKKKPYGCLIIILIIIFIIGFLIYGFYGLMISGKFTENTKKLIEKAPTKFTEFTQLIYPNDAVLKHISTTKLGANMGHDIILSLPNINSFIEDAKKKYNFESKKMNYPEIKGNKKLKDYNILYSDLCGNLNHGNDFQVKNPNNLRDFCGNRDILISQIKKETELGIIMVIFPNKKLVWVNLSGWF